MSSSCRLRCAVSATLLSLGLTGVASAQIPAFSGADGAARNVTGGRANASGGIVYHVTKLNSAVDDSQRAVFGTLRWGLDSNNFPAGVPRTIVFDVGGVFNLGRLPQPNAANGPWDPNGNGWDPQSRLTIGGSNVTLAGQTAPGSGVIFMGGGLKPQGNNNIIRNITVASGYGLSGWWKPGDPMPAVPGSVGASTDPSQWYPDNVVYDAMDIAGTNLMIDHVSTIYATDETISMNESANNVTVQYSSIGQALNYPQWDAEPPNQLKGHAYGSLLSAGSTTSQASISFHHNMYAHLIGRTPQIQGGNLGAYYDFRNNVFYNWSGTAGTKSGSTTFLNLINNFYLSGNGGDGPVGGTSPGMSTGTVSGGTNVISASSSIYRNGNLIDTNKDGDANDGVALSAGGAANPLWQGGAATYFGTTDNANQAFSRVLNYMGANWWSRDGVIDTPDERMINEARTGTGKIIGFIDDPWNASDGAHWQALKNTPEVSRASDWDTEASIGYGVGDGMPTYWEIAHGLDPTVRDDAGDFDSDGYTNLEEYLNEIAEWPAPGPIVFDATTNSRYAQITNWDSNPDAASDLPWQPSKYDTAQINSGIVVVDAVGQHAGTLQINNTATLSVTAGWINVATATVVSAGASFDQTGGYSSVAAISGAGSVNVAGGMMSAKSVRVSNLTIGDGVVQIAANGTAAGTSKVANLAISTGLLDLTNNNLVVTATPSGSWDGASYTGVLGMVSAGRNGGGWNGAGIVTSDPNAIVNYTSLGVATASEALGIATSATAIWSGQTVAGDDTLVMYTYGGDANLSGNVDIDDYGLIDFNASTGGTLTGWINGDFDYNGVQDIDDYGIIDFVVNIQGSPFPTADGMTLTSIPEPSAACGFAAFATALAVRRRRAAANHFIRRSR